MTKRSLVLVSLLFILTAATVHAQTFGAVLTPSQETPPTTSNGFGNATFTLDPTHTSITVNVTVSGLTTPITLAHIHKAAFGVAGSPLLDLAATTNFANGKLSKTFTIDKALGDDIAANPTNYYVNVHTTQNPGGEVRGQLTLVGDATLLFAELRGSNERPTPNSSTAVGSALVTIDNNNVLTYEVNIGGLQNPTLSHIHKGDANTAGSVVVSLATSSSAFSNGRTKGTTQVDPTLAADIKANPGNYYVNVHSQAFGGGELRGQLATANENDIAVAGNVTTGAGDKFVTDTRIFNPSFTTPAVALVEFLVSGSGGNTNATASETVVIPARGEAVLDDVTGANGLNTVGTTGAIRVTSQNQLDVTSNIFNDQRSANKGTFGQFVPGIGRSSELRRGVVPHLSNKTRDVTNPSGFRTNIGFFNPNQSSVFVRLELRDTAGNLLGQSSVTLAPLSQQQNAITAYFPGVDLSNASCTLSFDASAPIIVYGAVNDNVSGDSIFVVGQPDPGVSSSQL